jgi:hypothetical protein
MKLVFLLTSFLFSALIFSNENKLEAAKNYYRNGNFVEAQKLYFIACDKGDMDGCSGLGATEYRQGNKIEALKHLKIACDGKIEQACEIVNLISRPNSARTESSSVGSINSRIVGRWQDESTHAIYGFSKTSLSIEGGPQEMAFPYTLTNDGRLSFIMFGSKTENLVKFISDTQMELTEIKMNKTAKLRKIGDMLEAKSEETKVICNANYPIKLLNCSTFLCYFQHPFGGVMLKREILGFVNGACKTTEDMPGPTKMECIYPKEQLKGVAEFYTNSLNEKEAAANSSSKYSLNQSLQSGICKVVEK